MPTAYVYFGKPITPETATALLVTCRAIASDRGEGPDYLWDHLHLSIASGGGDVVAGFSIFNELAAFPLRLTTHNSSAVDSSALMPFLLGERRTASTKSAFYFHHFQWTFSTNLNQTRSAMWDAVKWLTTYEETLADLIAERTQIARDTALWLMRETKSMKPDEAKSLGLIHEIEEVQLPRDAQVAHI